MKHFFSLLIFFISFTNYSQDLDLESFASGFDSPTTITNAGDTRLFITEQSGEIKIVNSDGSVENTPFLDISDKLSGANEQGLLGLAFHPNYATNGFFYIHYTDTSGDTVISRYERNTINSADPDSELILLSVDQPFSNHNGGNISFGPDDKLYIALGDGGSGNDPQMNGQNINSLLGTILRLDVDIPAPYIPNDNPFVDTTGSDEIWAYGLRNPYKFSFDGTDLWIADVGDNIRGGEEEINRVINNPSNINYGWRCYEGNDSRNLNDTGCDNDDSFTFPIDSYDRNGNPNRCSITGGYVYRGQNQPNLFGYYIFGDYCSAELLLINPDNIDSNPNTTAIQAFGPFDVNITSFGVDSSNELYVGGQNNSTIFKVIDNNTVLDTPSFLKENQKDFIFPNPVKNSFSLQTKETISSMKLFDLTGSVVKEFTQTELESKQFSLNSVIQGFYIVILHTDKNKEFKEKIIIK